MKSGIYSGTPVLPTVLSGTETAISVFVPIPIPDGRYRMIFSGIVEFSASTKNLLFTIHVSDRGIRHHARDGGWGDKGAAAPPGPSTNSLNHKAMPLTGKNRLVTKRLPRHLWRQSAATATMYDKCCPCW